VVYRRRLPNDIGVVLAELGAFRQDIEGLVVESTYNWYWLVDGLMDVGFSVHLANTAAIVQYEGLKYADDESDARWLAKLLRLGLLPEGYIYPRQERAVRDLLRRRSKLVQQHSANLQSIQNLSTRSRGCSLSANQVKRLTDDEVDRLLPDADLALAVKGNLAVMRTQEGVIELLEKRVKGRGNTKNGNEYAGLKHTSRQRASRCVTTHRSSGIINANVRAVTRSWPSRRLPTSWRGPATTSCAIRCRST
uniref:IS110 family transposase n=1 Tax=Thiohalocapsa sp. TaxID=2497641 RepID=UPI0025DD2B2C